MEKTKYYSVRWTTFGHKANAKIYKKEKCALNFVAKLAKSGTCAGCRIREIDENGNPVRVGYYNW